MQIWFIHFIISYKIIWIQSWLEFIIYKFKNVASGSQLAHFSRQSSCYPEWISVQLVTTGRLDFKAGQDYKVAWVTWLARASLHNVIPHQGFINAISLHLCHEHLYLGSTSSWISLSEQTLRKALFAPYISIRQETGESFWQVVFQKSKQTGLSALELFPNHFLRMCHWHVVSVS